jgi:hypothetical protein
MTILIESGMNFIAGSWSNERSRSKVGGSLAV